MSLIKLLSKAEKDKVVLELVKEVNLAQADKADAWVMKPKSARRSFSLAKIGPHFLRLRNEKYKYVK
ncbi:hypothetical protein HPP92_009216 [Vanilla planifolia]|uniref:Uncharacterized protein n=1 Tax=Vanilla planifolia TaxID=51239 RepID=A0A835V4H7_VANPL|nr:hypothetical protein HPP92_009216 [Vanilla planifolia]